MIYKPNGKPNFLSEQNYFAEYQALSDTLSSYVNTGTLASFDGLPLVYEYYLAENARASVVIVHGFTEFMEKYHEMCKFYLDMGFNVFLYDQRGHGMSGRETEDFSKAHVSSFDAYAKDLEAFIDRVVRPISDKPLYLFSHSLGGTVSLLYMQRHPDAIQKAVLSAPMILPRTNDVPRFIVSAAVRLDTKKYGSDAPFRGARKFDANAVVEKSSDLSINRFRTNLKIRISDVHYQNSQITNGWITEALKVHKTLLSAKTKAISTDILLFTAEKDQVVFNKYDRKLIALLKNARQILIPGAKHNLSNGSAFILETFYSAIEEFLK